MENITPSSQSSTTRKKAKKMPDGKSEPIVTTDTLSGRQTVNIGRLLETDEGKAYRRDMAQVRVVSSDRWVTAKATQVVRKKK